jgi:phosphate transport system substrate-binding protein
MKLYPLRHMLSFVILILMIGGAIVARSAFANPQEKLIIAGTGSSIGVMKRMVDGFQKRHPNVIVDILPSIGSMGGIKAVKEGKIDIGLSARSLKPEEKIPGIIEDAYGRTAVIFGVQESNPIEGLRLTEIEEIYAGKRRTWSDGKHIRIILRPLSDAYSVFLAGINPGIKSASEQAHSIPGVFVGMTDREAAVQIERTPGSFGTASAAIVAAEKLKVKALSVDGVSPALPNVSAGKYPYAMTMSVVYKKDKYVGAVKDFIDFLFSNDGRKLLSANGHVTLPRAAGK